MKINTEIDIKKFIKILTNKNHDIILSIDANEVDISSNI